MAVCHQPPKFELPIAQEGMVYKIWDLVYKIVQNKYKILQNYDILFVLEIRFGGVASDMHLLSEEILYMFVKI